MNYFEQSLFTLCSSKDLVIYRLWIKNVFIFTLLSLLALSKEIKYYTYNARPNNTFFEDENYLKKKTSFLFGWIVKRAHKLFSQNQLFKWSEIFVFKTFFYLIYKLYKIETILIR